MKKALAIAIAVLPLLPVAGQKVLEDSFERLRVHYELSSVAIREAVLNGNAYRYADIEGFALGGVVGSPALPVRTDIITVPLCEKVSVTVENAVYDTLQAAGTLQWLPLQPPLKKSAYGRPAVVMDKTVYATDGYVREPAATVEEIGMARDRRLVRLSFSPVSVNPVTGQYVVCRSADLRVDYTEPDTSATLDHYRRYHTPAFEVGGSLNRLFGSKGVSTVAPLRMVVVASGTLRCRMLDEFVRWKRQQGLKVDLVYTGENGLTSNTAIASYLKRIYTNATSDSPAPTYLLLVGDHEQLPAFASRLGSDWNDHITDLYFATWTSDDILPDCYYGRFSVVDTVQLGNVVRKTLLYESYSFPNDAYLARAALVSGVDGAYPGDNAYEYSDPTMDYAAKFYVNSSNGYSGVRYYKNDTAYVPNGVQVTGSSQPLSVAGILRSYYNSGVGWINYSAHGDWNEWVSPTFSAANAGAMTNNNMPSFVVANCCFSNSFDMPACLGEAMLRKNNNGGAVAYIGGTNSTYWEQDFYWSVGVRSYIHGRMVPTYSSAHKGMYDCLFHTHSESFADRGVTAGSMLMRGNMSVQSSSSGTTMRKYYWEIYELMGDPSLLPWLGTASEMNFVADTSTWPIRVQAPPYAYVAVVDTTTLQVLGAAFTDAQGKASIALPAGTSLSATNFSATAQGYKPYFSKFSSVNIDLIPGELNIQLFPNPATTYCVVRGEKMKSVVLLDSRGCEVGSGVPAAGDFRIDLEPLPRGVYYVRVEAADSVGTKTLIVR